MVARVAARCVIGADLGGTKLLAGAVDADLGVHARAHREVAGLDPAALMATILEAVEEVRAGAPGEPAAAGFGIPCTIDRDRGLAVASRHLPLENVPFRDLMAERLGIPVAVDNDGNATAVGEHRHGAASGHADAVVLTVGTGIGGGLILGGRIYRGAQGAAGELGHVTIAIDGPECPGDCEGRGCLEALASGTALERDGARIAAERPDSGLGRAAAEGRAVTGALITELAHDGDLAAIEALRAVGASLGVGIAGFVNVFNPEVVVVGGGVMAAGDLLLDPAREVVAATALAPARDLVRVVPARFGAEAGMIGAAALAWELLAVGEALG